MDLFDKYVEKLYEGELKMKKLNEKELLNTNGGRIYYSGIIKHAWENRDKISKGFENRPGWRLPGGH